MGMNGRNNKTMKSPIKWANITYSKMSLRKFKFHLNKLNIFIILCTDSVFNAEYKNKLKSFRRNIRKYYLHL